MSGARAGAAIAFIAGGVVLQAASSPPLALGLALPIATGLAIGRWWALGLPLLPVPLYVTFRPDTGDLPAWFSVGGSVLLVACLLAAGVVVRVLIDRTVGP